MSFFILILLGALYYEYKKSLMLSNQRLSMQLQSESYLPRIHHWIDQRSEEDKNFPLDLAYQSAFYDTLEQPIISHLENTQIDFTQAISLHNGYIHFIIPLFLYKSEKFYIILETKDDGLWRAEAIQNFSMIALLLLSVLTLSGYFLTRLFLRPMRATITLLDNFIKDTTHELNTPVSAILSNIEMIEENSLEEKTQKKIRRINIAAKTISTLYDDLTYLSLNHQSAYEDRELNLKTLILERLEYFETRIEQKKIQVTTNLENLTLSMDETRAIRLFDNLLSNAIKYNRLSGKIEIRLTSEFLEVRDSGIGIEKEKLEKIFKRYERATQSVGGFGIGLHIVSIIAEHYHFRIEIDSKLKEGTNIRLWF